jgi:hypothetical protein
MFFFLPNNMMHTTAEIYTLISLFFTTITNPKSLENSRRPRVRSVPLIISYVVSESVCFDSACVCVCAESLLLYDVSCFICLHCALLYERYMPNIYVYKLIDWSYPSFVVVWQRTYAERNGGSSYQPGKGGNKLGGRGSNIKGVSQLGDANCAMGG